MPPTSKPPAPPSFYSNAMSMGGGTGAGSGKPDDAKKPAGEDEMEIVKTLFRVFEKWRKAAAGDQKKSDMIQQFSDLLEKYNNQFVKADMKSSEAGGAKEAPPATGSPDQGPGPNAASGMESSPVPA